MLLAQVSVVDINGQGFCDAELNLLIDKIEEKIDEIAEETGYYLTMEGGH